MKKLEHDLASLKSRVVEMGELVVSMIDLATTGLRDQNEEVLQEVYRREDRVNRIEVEIDRESYRLLTVYGPVAANLRLVLMVSRINSELERIADQAVNMCEYLRLLVRSAPTMPFPEAPRMARLVLEMLDQALLAFYHEDRGKAEHVLAKDGLVDATNHEVLRRCLGEGMEEITLAVAEILWARALERIADQATNICEDVVYIVSGEDIRHPARP